GACDGLYLRHLRTRQWRKSLLNSGADALASSGAAACFWVIAGRPSSLLSSAGAAAVAAFCYLALNIALISIPIAIDSRERYRSIAGHMGRLGIGAYPFAVLGLGLGWVYLQLGAWVVPLVVAPILIARAAFSGYLEVQAAQDQTIETLIHA